MKEKAVTERKAFDPVEYYSTYPSRVISRPGYPARAVFKSTLLFSHYGRQLFDRIGAVATYADVGGCFGFGAHAMGFQIAQRQGNWPRIIVFELAPGFVQTGKMLFPRIEFVEADFREWSGDVAVFDLLTLFDLVEHLVDPEAFLQHVAAHSRYAMLKTPMETPGEWRRPKPPSQVGANHPDGHVNFFSPRTYEALLTRCHLEIIGGCLVPSIVPPGARMLLLPEEFNAAAAGTAIGRAKEWFKRIALACVPFRWARKVVGGGDHLCLCRSRLCT